jgi:PAS domain S-box-containing protein
MVAARILAPDPDDLWRLTMEHSPVGMAIVSPAGDILTANVALCEMLGFDLGVLRSVRFQDLTHPDDLAEDLRMVGRCLAGEINAYRTTKRFTRADGGTVVGDLSMALLGAPDGTPVHFIVQIADLTEMVRAIRAKDEFITHVSHELRTPLAAAMAHLELVEESDDLAPAVQRQLTAVRRNVGRLSRLVADLLFATRATSGSSLVDPYRLDVVTVVAEALDAARVEAAIAGVTLQADLPDCLVAHVDGIRLRQAVDNLIGNAITYVPRNGHVLVALVADEQELCLVVEDDGEGIDPSDLPHVFDSFSRGENARSRHVPGAGLGLHIVKTIVEAHGGAVSAASQLGAGSTFRLTLPR